MNSYARLGLEATINTALAGDQTDPVVAGFTTGRFVVVWRTLDVTQDGTGSAIKLQRYNTNGVTVGGEVLVNSDRA